MTIKLLEIRDRATFIPAMAIRLFSMHEREFYLLRRAGFSKEALTGQKDYDGDPYIVLVKFTDFETNYDPFCWRNDRTMGTVHRHIIEHWSSIESGDVIDVEFILGETTTSKCSERLDEHAEQAK